jgi:hypothetical protein
MNPMPIDESTIENNPAYQPGASLATPWAYMQQIYSGGATCTGAPFPYPGPGNTPGVYPNSAAAGTLFAAIYQRCKEIQPSVTPHDVAKLLDSQNLPMGQQYYIYLLNADQNGTGGPIHKGLVLSSNLPPAFNTSSPQLPDGVPVTTANACFAAYRLCDPANPGNDNFIDVQRDPPCGWPLWPLLSPCTHQADLDLHDQPYSIIQPVTDGSGNQLQPITGNDFALWQDSSGAGNLLGHLEFANTVVGGNYFSTPN